MRRGRLAAALALASAALLATIWFWHLSSRQDAGPHSGPRPSPRQLRTHPTLVVYILSLADAVYLENFYFFLREAIHSDASTRYHILIASASFGDPTLPPLPAHASYVVHDGLCGGLALARQHLLGAQGHEALSAVQRVVLTSSAVRGPFVPPGLKRLLTWHAALGADLGGRTALAAPAVSCAHTGMLLPREAAKAPFPEFTAIAATRAAIELLLRLDDPQTMGCRAPPPKEEAEAPADVLPLWAPHVAPAPRAMADPAALFGGEGLTAAEVWALQGLRSWALAVVGAGLRMESLAVRQRGVDWADARTWRCNGGLTPFAPNANDGVSLAPYEAMFVPVGTYDIHDMPYSTPPELARLYTEWMQAGPAEYGAWLARTDADAAYAGLAATAAAAGARAAAAAALRVSAAAADAEAIAEAATLAGGAAAEAVSRALSGVLPPAAPLSRDQLVDRNRYYWYGNVFKLPAVLFAVALGEDCFDADYFRQSNPDIAILPPRDAWKFFVFAGQFQPRPFRLKCGVNWAKYGLWRASGGGKGRGGGGA